MREALLAVGDAVGQARLHEAAVAAAGGRADLVGVDQHDVARRVALLGDDGRPQPGVAAADDAQVAGLGAHQRRVAVGLVGVVVPVRVGVGVGDCVEVEFVDCVIVVTVVDGHLVSPPVGMRRYCEARYGRGHDHSCRCVPLEAGHSGWTRGDSQGPAAGVRWPAFPRCGPIAAAATSASATWQNFDFGIVAEFDTVDDWRVYDKHPRHEEIRAGVVRPWIETRASVQFESLVRFRSAVAADMSRASPAKVRGVGAAAAISSMS